MSDDPGNPADPTRRRGHRQGERAPRESRVDALVDRLLLPFVDEPTLWPVLLVVVGHAVAFAAPVLLLALRDGRAAGFAGLTALLLPTAATLGYEVRRRGRPGALSGVWLATWVASGCAAAVADHYGLF